MGIENVKNIKSNIDKLEKEKLLKRAKHREVARELKNLGVNKNKKNSNERTSIYSNERSDTYKKILGPIENEIAEISKAILVERESIDAQKQPKEVLEEKLDRLTEILYFTNTEFTEFLKTKIGSRVLEKSGIDNVEDNPEEMFFVLDNKFPLFDEAFDEGGRGEYNGFMERYIIIKDLMKKVKSKLEKI